MKDNTQKQFIIAERSSDDKYDPEGLEATWEKIYEGLEYGDVYEGNYQIWEYPSGKIFKMEPDRKVEVRNYYSTPHNTLWLPKLTLLETDKKKVEGAYIRLSNVGKMRKRSLISRIKRWFLKK